LMGIFSILFPISSAMVIHGVTQMASNSSRAYLFRKDIQYKVVAPYFIGSLFSLALFSWIQFLPSKEFVLIALGLSPLLGFSFSKKLKFNILKKSNAFMCGILVMATQIMAGASGPILDVFYLNSELEKEQVIATKSFTQSFSHFMKLGYYGQLLLSGTKIEAELPWIIFPIAILTAFTGTRLGKLVLDRLSEQQFRKYGKSFAIGIGLFYFSKGIMGFV
ncbi:MAG: TSUP family transporter, partial [Bdellovibrionota bacterium]|nr:TSUP family transporter [Bdellovibrionota bacterium]